MVIHFCTCNDCFSTKSWYKNLEVQNCCVEKTAFTLHTKEPVPVYWDLWRLKTSKRQYHSFLLGMVCRALCKKYLQLENWFAFLKHDPKRVTFHKLCSKPNGSYLSHAVALTHDIEVCSKITFTCINSYAQVYLTGQWSTSWLNTVCLSQLPCFHVSLNYLHVRFCTPFVSQVLGELLCISKVHFGFFPVIDLVSMIF